MTTPLVDIDARAAEGEVQATDRVGGIPLVVRPLRHAARAGFTRARVRVADPAQAARVQAVLARYPVAPSLAVEISADAGAGVGEPAQAEPGSIAIDARAIYARDALAAAASGGPAPQPLLRLRAPSDRAGAERLLYAQIRKSVEGDGFFAHYLIRPLTRPLSRALLGTRVSPNQVTVAAMLCGLVAAGLAAAGGALLGAIAGALYWLGNALDCVDGDLARLRLQSSKAGEWLDSMADEVSTFSLLAGLGIGLFREGAGDVWLAVGLGGSAIGALTVARLYVDLHRMGLPIDTAQFPWFFQRKAGEPAAPEPAAPARPSAASRVVGALGYLIRRDANVTGVALLCLIDQREVAVALVALGALAGGAVTLVHYAVMARRRAASG
ncbi:MAG TPA: CDP-alcohol phosphatidyltransferase family protein [Kofleriaceae bacterium]|nr:CDP-alcohol phosphatidyltransferase family protein [Kofleriaceae bacterium]